MLDIVVETQASCRQIAAQPFECRNDALDRINASPKLVRARDRRFHNRCRFLSGNLLAANKAYIQGPVACIDSKIKHRRLIGSVPSNSATRYVRDKVKGQTPSRRYYTAFPRLEREHLADRRPIESYPLQRRYRLKSPTIQSRFDKRRDHAMRSLQRHHVECAGLVNICSNALCPLANAHRHDTVSGQENRRPPSKLTGRGRHLVLAIVDYPDRAVERLLMANGCSMQSAYVA